ncbi:uncharacterized [Tachysurus ichikawai]
MRFSEALVCCTALSEELRANMQQEIQAKAYVGLGGFSDLEDKKMYNLGFDASQICMCESTPSDGTLACSGLVLNAAFHH